MTGKCQKIAFVLPSLGTGGAERVVSTLAGELSERGMDVSIIMTANNSMRYRLSPAVKVICLNCTERYQNANTAKRYLGRIRDIRNAVAQIAPDVVIAFMAETNIDVCLAMMGTSTPVIVSERNDPAVDPRSRAKQILRSIVYARANGFVFQTPDAQSYFRKSIRDRSCVILNPLTQMIPPPYPGRRDRRIVAVGRLEKQKNYPLLLDAFREFHRVHPDYVLEIYGDGVLRENVWQAVEDHDLTHYVRLMGFCEDVHSRIRTAAFYVMSSDFEGMPNALIEAMAMGLPCISTDCPCGGPRILIEHGKNGLLVPTNDQNALLSAMLNMAGDSKSAADMGLEATRVRERVELQCVTKQWIDFIEKAKKDE